MYLDRRLGLATEALGFARQDHDVLQKENSANSSAISRLLGQLEAANKEQEESETACEDLRRELAIVTLKRQEMEAKVNVRSKEVSMLISAGWNVSN